MRFVYLHIAWFSLWIGLGVESYPYGLLTMIVSLEAIFLSTFVMISQNRADAKREVLANQQWDTVQDEDRQNQELLQLSHQILELTKALHASMTSSAAAATQGAGAPARRSWDHRVAALLRAGEVSLTLPLREARCSLGWSPCRPRA